MNFSIFCIAEGKMFLYLWKNTIEISLFELPFKIYMNQKQFKEIGFIYCICFTSFFKSKQSKFWLSDSFDSQELLILLLNSSIKKSYDCT